MIVEQRPNLSQQRTAIRHPPKEAASFGMRGAACLGISRHGLYDAGHQLARPAMKRWIRFQWQ